MATKTKAAKAKPVRVKDLGAKKSPKGGMAAGIRRDK